MILNTSSKEIRIKKSPDTKKRITIIRVIERMLKVKDNQVFVYWAVSKNGVIGRVGSAIHDTFLCIESFVFIYRGNSLAENMVIVGYDSCLGKCFGPELLHFGVEMLAHAGLVARSCSEYLVLREVPLDTPQFIEASFTICDKNVFEYSLYI